LENIFAFFDFTPIRLHFVLATYTWKFKSSYPAAQGRMGSCKARLGQ